MAYLSVVIYQKDLLIKPLTYRKGITALIIPLMEIELDYGLDYSMNWCIYSYICGYIKEK